MYAAKKCGKYVVEFLRRLEFWLSLIIFFSRHKEISWPPDTSTVDCVHPSFSDPIWLQATKAKESNGMPVIKIEKILSQTLLSCFQDSWKWLTITVPWIVTLKLWLLFICSFNFRAKNLLLKITFTRFFRMSQILTTKSKGNIGQQTLQIYINMGSIKNIIEYNVFFFWNIKTSLKDTDKK